MKIISEIFSAESFFWNCLWQSTIFIAAGLLGSFILRHRSARAHQILLLSIIAAVIVPVLSTLVKHYELGLFAASRVKIPVVDKTESSEQLRIPYRHHSSSLLRNIKDKVEKKRKLQMLLTSLTDQTELQFKVALQPVEIWFVTETKD